MKKILSLVILIGLSMGSNAHAKVQVLEVTGKHFENIFLSFKLKCSTTMSEQISDPHEDGIETAIDIVNIKTNADKTVTVSGVCEGNLRDTMP